MQYRKVYIQCVDVCRSCCYLAISTVFSPRLQLVTECFSLVESAMFSKIFDQVTRVRYLSYRIVFQNGKYCNWIINTNTNKQTSVLTLLFSDRVVSSSHISLKYLCKKKESKSATLYILMRFFFFFLLFQTMFSKMSLFFRFGRCFIIFPKHQRFYGFV